MLVLLVDDNHDLQHLFALDLGLAGLDVVAVGSVGEAAEVLAARDVGVLVTDRFLDDGDGEVLAHQAAGVPAIVMSGSYERLAVVDERLVHLPKPFTRSALLALLQERLAAV